MATTHRNHTAEWGNVLIGTTVYLPTSDTYETVRYLRWDHTASRMDRMVVETDLHSTLFVAFSDTVEVVA